MREARDRKKRNISSLWWKWLFIGVSFHLIASRFFLVYLKKEWYEWWREDEISFCETENMSESPRAMIAMSIMPLAWTRLSFSSIRYKLEREESEQILRESINFTVEWSERALIYVDNHTWNSHPSLCWCKWHSQWDVAKIFEDLKQENPFYHCREKFSLARQCWASFTLSSRCNTNQSCFLLLSKLSIIVSHFISIMAGLGGERRSENEKFSDYSRVAAREFCKIFSDNDVRMERTNRIFEPERRFCINNPLMCFSALFCSALRMIKFTLAEAETIIEFLAGC